MDRSLIIEVGGGDQVLGTSKLFWDPSYRGSQRPEGEDNFSLE